MNNKRTALFCKTILFGLFVLTLLSLSACKKEGEETEEMPKPAPRDILVVLDTSLSMVGYGGENVMPKVKDSLARWITTVNPGDTFTFMTFDTTVKVYPTVDISDDNDKEIIKNYIGIVEAEGQWTYTMEMLREVILKATLLEQTNEAEKTEESPERKVVIIILTDALDDPPPAEKDKQLDIKSLANANSNNEWFLFLINLADIENNEKVQQLKKELQEHITANAQVIESSDINQTMDDINGEIITPTPISTPKPIYQSAWFYLLLILIVFIVIAVIYAQYNSRIKLSGTIEYKNQVVLGAEFQSSSLDRYEARRISIGKDSLCQIRIPDFESNQAFVFEAGVIKGELQVFINTDRGAKVHYLEGQGDPYLTDGTRFEIGGYEFRFRAKTKG